MNQGDLTAAVQRFYDAEAAYMATDARDFAPVAATLTWDVLLCEPSSLPYGGEHRGLSAVEGWIRAFKDAWASIEVGEVAMVGVGNLVFSRSHVQAQARNSGKRADWPLLQMFRISHGKVAELRPFHWDTAAMLPALRSDDQEGTL